MSRNIVIFSDGTGQRGGLLFDERRSNVYKLYRAARCGPDSNVNPNEQLAFYDPGIGTLPAGIGLFGAIWRWTYNLVSQATGLGLTRNIIDCYAAILQMWEPGDRIFLFGFSRGAYTVRCLAGILALCGVPTQMKDGTSLKRDMASAGKIAKEAVRKVYQHVSSPRDTKFIPQRLALAERFRERYGANNAGISNAFPHFIGVFDTVAALASYGSLAIAIGITLVFILVVSSIFWFFFSSFWLWFWMLVGIAVIFILIAYIATHIKVAFGLLEFPWWKTLHFTKAKMQFYDQQLNENVGWARHALAIDEHRAEFDRVPWGSPETWRKVQADEPTWFEQYWFAGDHADIGGGYAENESRLSDISFRWMADAAQSVPDGIIIDTSVLQLYPSADGMQHDECQSSIFRFARKINRLVPHDATLHDTVYERLSLPSVVQYNMAKPYRPDALRDHDKLKQYYEP